MRLKGDGQALGAQCLSRMLHLLQDMLMCAVHAVEVSRAEHSFSELCGKFFEVAKDQHGSLNLEFQLQAIVRQLYVLRQSSVGFRMAQIVRNMGEKSALRTQPFDKLE